VEEMASSVIGEMIRNCQREADISVDKLSEVLPADRRTVFRYRAGTCLKPDTIARLAQIFKKPELLECYCQECPVKQVRIKQKKETRWLERILIKIAN
jgi:predicted transcriptional regulator